MKSIHKIFRVILLTTNKQLDKWLRKQHPSRLQTGHGSGRPAGQVGRVGFGRVSEVAGPGHVVLNLTYLLTYLTVHKPLLPLIQSFWRQDHDRQDDLI